MKNKSFLSLSNLVKGSVLVGVFTLNLLFVVKWDSDKGTLNVAPEKSSAQISCESHGTGRCYSIIATPCESGSGFIFSCAMSGNQDDYCPAGVVSEETAGCL